MDLGAAPSANELEVTLLGPGYGESIAIHLTSGQWMIVDSCKPSSLKTPAALHYLSSINVDPANVVFVAATHWHDDHVAGIASVLDACTSARFVMAAALQSKEFARFARFFGDQPETAIPGAGELWNSLGILKSRAQKKGTLDIAWATSGRVLWQTELAGVPVEIAALSPSDADLTNAIAAFGDMRPQTGDPVARAPHANPNHSAVVLRVTVGDHTILLGADLETTKKPDTGWNAVVACRDMKARPASLYKVAHHGSATGEHPQIWSTLLQSAPISVLTPYRNGRTKLPTDGDQIRIKAASSALWTTSRRSNNLGISKSVEKTMKRKARHISVATATYGIVRARRDIIKDATWNIQGFGAAEQC